jgi:hypothetical protein
MKHVILAGALAFAAALGAGGVVANAASSDRAVPSEPTTLEGCLLAGSATGEFIISTGKERHTAVAAQGVDLAAHVSHRVRLTGALEKSTLGEVFRVTAVTTVSNTCAAT